MTLAEQLGYVHRRPNFAQRAMRKFASTRAGSWLFSKSLRHADRLVARYAKGRTVPEVLAGLRTVFVTTIGARSGKQRTSALVGVPVGDGIALIGTNFGGARTPNWYHNLRAHPKAEIRYHETMVNAVAREIAPGAEYDAIMRAASRVYAGYRAYEARIKDRPIHVMVLDQT
jgi:deazaflavin-dependent oxidoreductase (nitroreductase family)